MIKEICRACGKRLDFSYRDKDYSVCSLIQREENIDMDEYEEDEEGNRWIKFNPQVNCDLKLEHMILGQKQ